MKYEMLFKQAPDILTIPEVAKLLRIGKNQAYDLVKDGRVGAVRLGKKLIVPKPALIDFCQNEQKNLLVMPK